MDEANPETTLEELSRIREEQQASRTALMALCNADDAYQASYKIVMRSPLSKSLDESSSLERFIRQRDAAITLCVELGRSLKDHLSEDAGVCGRCGGPGPLNQQGMCWHCQ